VNRRSRDLEDPVSFPGRMTAAVEVEGLVKRYGSLTAVDGIRFDVAPGSVFAFLGPNGAGKTTTVEILEGLRRPTAGTIRVLGLDPWRDGEELHRQAGVIPQEFRFFEKITAREAIEYYRSLFGTSVDAADLLARVELLDKANDRFDTLSGGQKQKLGLALALTNDPKICFLDEPTTGLDPHARRAIWSVIRSLRRDGRTVFLTTHYLEEAQLLADRVAIIHHGRIIAAGTPEEIIRAHGRPARLRVDAPPALADYLRRELGVEARAEGGHVETDLADKRDALRILAAIDRSGLSWDRVATEEETLEDVFVRLVGQMDEGTLKAEVPA
jgi:ABC-2 type transport system ATP-binding protein